MIEIRDTFEDTEIETPKVSRAARYGKGAPLSPSD